jgi:hypothetical protein
MQTVDTLLHKLNEQRATGEPLVNLLTTVQQLWTALQEEMTTVKTEHAFVSVVMPFQTPITQQQSSQSIEHKVHTNVIADDSLKSNTFIEGNETGATEGKKDIPNFTENATSLNDKLKPQQKELATTLQETPIKDLRKAIGINDRYLFVKELFNGDENLFEKSIKTINNFSLYPEAAFWVQKELQQKLGWKDDNEVVAVFNQLVRRRFS